jgi:hypothetical protein avisC_03905
MKIAIFGATGMVGSAIVSEALTRGHCVIALSRHPKTDVNIEQLTAQAVDVADSEALDPILAKADAAVLTIRLAPGHEARLASLTQRFLDVAARHHTRVLVIGGAAPLRSPNRPDRLLIDDPAFVPEAWQMIARASLNQFRICQEHRYKNWVYLSPPATLERGERTGHYRRGTTTLLTDENGVSRISTSDLAIAVIDELDTPGDDQHFTVAQGLPV